MNEFSRGSTGICNRAGETGFCNMAGLSGAKCPFEGDSDEQGNQSTIETGAAVKG